MNIRFHRELYVWIQPLKLMQIKSIHINEDKNYSRKEGLGRFGRKAKPKWEEWIIVRISNIHWQLIN